MKKFNEYMEMYRWVLLIVVFFIGWGVVAVYGTVFLIVFYPLYGAIALAGAVMVKNQNQEIHDLADDVIKKEIVLRSSLFIASLIICFLFRNQTLVSFEIVIVLIFAMLLIPVDVYLKHKELKKRSLN